MVVHQPQGHWSAQVVEGMFGVAEIVPTTVPEAIGIAGRPLKIRCMKKNGETFAPLFVSRHPAMNSPQENRNLQINYMLYSGLILPRELLIPLKVQILFPGCSPMNPTLQKQINR